MIIYQTDFTLEDLDGEINQQFMASGEMPSMIVMTSDQHGKYIELINKITVFEAEELKCGQLMYQGIPIKIFDRARTNEQV